jgi:hypothetical protein
VVHLGGADTIEAHRFDLFCRSGYSLELVPESGIYFHVCSGLVRQFFDDVLPVFPPMFAYAAEFGHQIAVTRLDLPAIVDGRRSCELLGMSSVIWVTHFLPTTLLDMLLIALRVSDADRTSTGSTRVSIRRARSGASSQSSLHRWLVVFPVTRIPDS